MSCLVCGMLGLSALGAGAGAMVLVIKGVNGLGLSVECCVVADERWALSLARKRCRDIAVRGCSDGMMAEVIEIEA